MSIYAVVESNTTQNDSTTGRFRTNIGCIIGQQDTGYCDSGWQLNVNDGDARSWVAESEYNCGFCKGDLGFIEENAYSNTGRNVICLRWKTAEEPGDRINSLTVANYFAQETSTGNTDFGQWLEDPEDGPMWTGVQRLTIGCTADGSGAAELNDSFWRSYAYQGKMFRILAYSTCHSETVRDEIIKGLKETYNIS